MKMVRFHWTEKERHLNRFASIPGYWCFLVSGLSLQIFKIFLLPLEWIWSIDILLLLTLWTSAGMQYRSLKPSIFEGICRVRKLAGDFWLTRMYESVEFSIPLQNCLSVRTWVVFWCDGLFLLASWFFASQRPVWDLKIVWVFDGCCSWARSCDAPKRGLLHFLCSLIFDNLELNWWHLWCAFMQTRIIWSGDWYTVLH